MKTIPFIQEAHRVGVDRFVVDSPGELAKLAEHAPGSRVYARVIVDNSGSEWPLTKKYGVSGSEAVALLHQARQLGLQPYGLTFHVGSQCRDVRSWGAALRRCQTIWTELHRRPQHQHPDLLVAGALVA